MIDPKSTLLKAAGAADIPIGAVAGLSEIRITAMRTVVIGPHRGIRSFAGDCVLVETGEGIICVHGRGLELKNMSREEVRLTGEIRSVERMDRHAL